MGFSGGGSNILKPHTHDGTIAQDGGALNMDGITQGSLTAGDVVFSDGSNLQRLAIGSASDQMRVNAGATAPEWFTPAAAASGSVLAWEEFTLGSNSSTWTVTFATPYVLADYNQLRVDFMIGHVTNAYDINVTYNTGLTGNHYFNNGIQVSGSTVSAINVSNNGDVPLGTNIDANSSVSGTLNFQENEATTTRNLNSYTYCSNGNPGTGAAYGAHWYEGTYTQISALTFSVSSGNMLQNSRIRTYRISNP